MSEVSIQRLKQDSQAFVGFVAETQKPANAYGELATQASDRYQGVAAAIGEAISLLGGFDEIRKTSTDQRKDIGEGLEKALKLAGSDSEGLGFAGAKNPDLRNVPGRTANLANPADLLNGNFLQSSATAEEFAKALAGIKERIEEEGGRVVSAIQEPTQTYNGEATEVVRIVDEWQKAL